jgi:hypothetical protein
VEVHVTVPNSWGAPVSRNWQPVLDEFFNSIAEFYPSSTRVLPGRRAMPIETFLEKCRHRRKDGGSFSYRRAALA